MIALSAMDRRILDQCLSSILPPQAAVYVFGSRAAGTACRGSDLDLAVDAGDPLPFSVLTEILDRLEESDLSFTVDLVDLHRITPEFRDRIAGGMVPLVRQAA